MRICLVHSFYRSDLPSGENVSVLELQSALLRRGHDVQLVRRDSDDLGPVTTLQAGIAVATGVGASPLHELHQFNPDVVHVHNLFPNFGRHWLHRLEGPMVATLHNFRTLCARGTLYRDGAVCTLCPQGQRWQAVRHKCYRDSAFFTLPWSASTSHGVRDPLIGRAQRIVVLSERSRDVFVRFGMDTSKLVVVPNGMTPFASPRPAGLPHKWILLGRLDPGKGARRLLRNWPVEQTLDVVGDGPLLAELRRSSRRNVHFLGMRDPRWVRENLPGYAGLVFPSRLLENSPLTVIEALSCGVPVVARAGSAGADIVRQGAPEWLYEHDDVANALARVSAQGEGARDLAAQIYRAHHGVDAWMDRLEDVYRQAVAAEPHARKRP